MFITPIPEPRAGKPRRFPTLALYEAALLAHASRVGLPLSLVSAIYESRIWEGASLYVLKTGEAAAYYLSEAVKPAIESGELTEFHFRGKDHQTYWVAKLINQDELRNRKIADAGKPFEVQNDVFIDSKTGLRQHRGSNEIMAGRVAFVCRHSSDGSSNISDAIARIGGNNPDPSSYIVIDVSSIIRDTDARLSDRAGFVAAHGARFRGE